MIRFDESNHSYWMGDRRLPSVTQIISPLYDFSMVDQEVLERKSKIGTAVHTATELFDNDDLDMDSVHPIVLPYLQAWMRFRDETGFTPILNERRIFHSGQYYAGTLDRTGTFDRMFVGEMAVIDIKTVTQIKPMVGVQIEAYRQALISEGELEPTIRAAVQLRDDGTYRLEQCKDPKDWAIFLSLLNIHNYKLRHNL